MSHDCLLYTSIPVGLDEQGVKPDALRSGGAAVLHISPAHQYPTGLVTPLPRRQELLTWAQSTGGYIIEDDYDSELSFTPMPLPTLSSICLLYTSPRPRSGGEWQTPRRPA